jgi:hypothetical protein
MPNSARSHQWQTRTGIFVCVIEQMAAIVRRRAHAVTSPARPGPPGRCASGRLHRGSRHIGRCERRGCRSDSRPRRRLPPSRHSRTPSVPARRAVDEAAESTHAAMLAGISAKARHRYAQRHRSERRIYSRASPSRGNSFERARLSRMRLSTRGNWVMTGLLDGGAGPWANSVDMARGRTSPLSRPSRRCRRKGAASG